MDEMDSRISEDILEEEDENAGPVLSCSDALVALKFVVEATVGVAVAPSPGGFGAVVMVLVGSTVKLLLLPMIVTA